MKNVIPLFLIIILMAVCSGNSLCLEERRVEDGGCRLKLDKTDFFSGELITIEFSWNSVKDFQSGIAGDLMVGRACLEFTKGQKVVHIVDLSPFSAPRRKGDVFSISTAVPVKSRDYIFQEGEYQVKAVSKRWKTTVAIFNVRSQHLLCRIKEEKRFIASNSPFLVNVTITNVSDHGIDAKMLPVFYIDGMKYWCPVDIVHGGMRLAANASTHIILDKGASFTAKVDLAKAGWDLCISSAWPSKALFSVIPPGSHELHLDLELVQKRIHICSNKVQLQVGQ